MGMNWHFDKNAGVPFLPIQLKTIYHNNQARKPSLPGG
jgi:hypothetical protein